MEVEKGPYSATGREVLSEAAVMLVAALVIHLFAQRTALVSAAMAAIIILRFILLNRRGDWIIFLLGMVVGGGNDVMSMWRGVYSYTPPTLIPGLPEWMLPVWMLFFWGEGFIFFRKLVRWGPLLGDDQRPRLLDTPLALDIAIAVVYRVIVYRWASEPWLPAALYAAILAVRMLVIPPAAHERRLMLSILVLGPLYEAILIKSGLYLYQNPAFLGMPLWLIIYWVFIIRVLKAVIDRIEHYLTGHSQQD